MDAYYEYQAANDKDPYANLIIAVSPTNSSIGALISMVYLKPEEEPAAFAPFYSIETLTDSTAIKNFTTYLAEYAVPEVARYVYSDSVPLFEAAVQLIRLLQVRLARYKFRARKITIRRD